MVTGIQSKMKVQGICYYRLQAINKVHRRVHLSYCVTDATNYKKYEA